MGAFFAYLQSLDRRWIYLVLSVVLIVALINGKPSSQKPLPSVRQLYNAIEKAPAGPGEGKIILVGTVFAANTIGESGNQFRAIIRHLMLSHKRFALISIGEPQGTPIGLAITRDLAERYGYVYGTDWISFGYQLNSLAVYKALPLNIPGFVKVDGRDKKPLATFPIMAKVKTIRDVALHVEVTASDSVYSWLQIIQPTTKPRLQIGYACTGVMATEAYPYLDSGQMVGMLPGLRGAADYEVLVDELEARRHLDAGPLQPVPQFGLYRSARHLMAAQNAAHIVIILFIILGNVGMLLTRRPARQKEAAHES